MIEVESRKATSASPSSGGTKGRAPVSMKIWSAVSRRVPPALRATSIVCGAVKRAQPQISSVLGVSSMRLA